MQGSFRAARPRLAALLVALAWILVGLTPASAAEEEACPGLVASRGWPVVPAAFGSADSGPEDVRLTFVGHATFLIESPGGVTIATDYNDYVRPSIVPQVVTMNRAHSTHYSNHPDPGIRTILRGWNQDGGEAPRWDVTEGDVHIRNVVTNIREWGSQATIFEGNSIFVFETAGLCIAHLGHLHHTLTTEHLRQLGRIDVVLVPVDGSYTLDLDGMMDVLESLNPRVMIPMHFFGPSTLARFLDKAASRYDVSRRNDPTLILSRAALPVKPTVIVLPGH